MRKLVLLLAVSLFSMSRAYATPEPTPPPFLDVNGDGFLLGATILEVDGTVYDVTFVDGTCAELFGGCDDPLSDFAFQTRGDAEAAGQALLDRVFLDVLAGAFDSRPELTIGIESENSANILIPYDLIDSGKSVRSLAATNSARNSDDGLVGPIDALTIINTLDDAGSVYAVFTISTQSVPEPATLSLMLIAMMGLIGIRCNKQCVVGLAFLQHQKTGPDPVLCLAQSAWGHSRARAPASVSQRMVTGWCAASNRMPTGRPT